MREGGGCRGAGEGKRGGAEGRGKGQDKEHKELTITKEM